MTLEKRNWGMIFIILYVLTAGYLFLPQDISLSPVPVPDDLFLGKKIAESLASLAMILMGFGIILGASFRFLEPYFGGLDRMYRVHKIFGIISIWLLIAHFALIPEIGEDEGLGGPLGIISLLGFTILILLTIVKKFPYHRWFPTHRFMGVFYIVGIAHTFVAGNMIIEGSAFSVLLRAIAFTAAAAYIYKELIRERFVSPRQYQIAEINYLGSATELVLKSDKDKIKWQAGQFAFISLRDEAVSKEKHPFTISAGPDDDQLRFTIKSLGDYTKSLSALSVGSDAVIDGPFGHFTPNVEASPQVWVAGGVGVTPFLSAIRDKSAPNREVTFFYTVRDQSDALFLDEIRAWAKESSNRSFHLICSNQKERLSFDLIREQIKAPVPDIAYYLCGPTSLVSSITKQAKAAGARKANIHFEEFSIR